MSDIKKLKIFSELPNAGWFEGRDISHSFLGLPLTAILPDKIIQVLTEFGGLTFESRFKTGELKQKVELPSAAFLGNKALATTYSNYTYKPGEKIDLKKGEENNWYYYSVLLGTPIYPISDLAENGVMLMDKFGNVYELNFLNDFYWVGHDILHGLEKLLYGEGSALLLGGGKNIEWIGEQKEYKPPLNQNLNGIDPWA